MESAVYDCRSSRDGENRGDDEVDDLEKGESWRVWLRPNREDNYVDD